MNSAQRLRGFLYVFLTIVVLLCISGCVIEPKPIKLEPIEPEPLGSRVLSFSGYEWMVKSGKTPVGPGPNYFSDSSKNVWIDKRGRLHLRIIKRNGKWYCAQVISKKSFGYGKYTFYLANKVDRLDENVVAGLFIFENVPKYNHCEIDIEFSKWGQRLDNNAQYAVQPSARFENSYKFNIQLNGKCSTHGFIWRSQSVFFQSLHGHYTSPPKSIHIIKSWEYTGKNILPPGNEKVRINLWLFKGNPPLNNKGAEIIIKKFEFVPQTEIN